jgi:hypothetical protein
MATRAELLARLNMSDADFRGYLTNYTTFLNGLNANQLAFHKKNNKLKSIAAVAASLGPDVTADDVKALFAQAPPDGNMMMAVSCCDITPNP